MQQFPLYSQKVHICFTEKRFVLKFDFIIPCKKQQKSRQGKQPEKNNHFPDSLIILAIFQGRYRGCQSKHKKCCHCILNISYH